MKKHYQHSSTFTEELRLVFLNSADREREVETAEANSGKNAKDPLEALNDRTKKLALKLKNERAGWMAWINNFGSTKRADGKIIQNAVLEEATKRLDAEMNKADDNLNGFWRRGQRRLLLESYQKQIMEDLQNHIQTEINERSERADRYGKLSAFLRNGTGLITVAELKSSKRLSTGLDYASQKDSRSASKKQMPRNWVRAEQSEQMLREQLPELGIATDDQVADLLEKHMDDKPDLINAIESSPQLVQNTALKKLLLASAQKVRKGGARGYRIMKAITPDRNIQSLPERMEYMRNDTECPPGTKVTFSVNGEQITSRVVAHKGEITVLRDQANSKRMLILDTTAGVVACRRSSDNKVIDYDLSSKANSFSIAA